MVFYRLGAYVAVCASKANDPEPEDADCSSSKPFPIGDCVTGSGTSHGQDPTEGGKSLVGFCDADEVTGYTVDPSCAENLGKHDAYIEDPATDPPSYPFLMSTGSLSGGGTFTTWFESDGSTLTIMGSGPPDPFSAIPSPICCPNDEDTLSEIETMWNEYNNDPSKDLCWRGQAGDREEFVTNFTTYTCEEDNLYLGEFDTTHPLTGKITTHKIPRIPGPGGTTDPDDLGKSAKKGAGNCTGMKNKNAPSLDKFHECSDCLSHPDSTKNFYHYPASSFEFCGETTHQAPAIFPQGIISTSELDMGIAKVQIENGREFCFKLGKGEVIDYCAKEGLQQNITDEGRKGCEQGPCDQVPDGFLKSHTGSSSCECCARDQPEMLGCEELYIDSSGGTGKCQPKNTSGGGVNNITPGDLIMGVPIYDPLASYKQGDYVWANLAGNNLGSAQTNNGDWALWKYSATGSMTSGQWSSHPSVDNTSYNKDFDQGSWAYTSVYEDSDGNADLSGSDGQSFLNSLSSAAAATAEQTYKIVKCTQHLAQQQGNPCYRIVTDQNGKQRGYYMKGVAPADAYDNYGTPDAKLKAGVQRKVVQPIDVLAGENGTYMAGEYGYFTTVKVGAYLEGSGKWSPVKKCECSDSLCEGRRGMKNTGPGNDPQGLPLNDDTHDDIP